jgi:hypothetical protein
MYRLCDTTNAALLALLLLLPAARAAGEQSSDDSAGDGPALATLPNPEGRPENPGPSAHSPALAGSDSLTQPDAQAQRAAQAADKRAQRRRTRLVYACRDSPIPVFSDRPCGADANAWRIDVPPPATTGAAPSTRAAAPAAATRPIVAAPPRDDRSDAPERCARLEHQLAAINARMREGYSAREAARLWQRWRDAKAKLRAERC